MDKNLLIATLCYFFSIIMLVAAMNNIYILCYFYFASGYYLALTTDNLNKIFILIIMLIPITVKEFVIDERIVS